MSIVTYYTEAAREGPSLGKEKKGKSLAFFRIVRLVLKVDSSVCGSLSHIKTFA